MIVTQNPPPTKTAVRYNAHGRTWEAINGTTTPTGNGPEGKRAALLLALAHDQPALAGKVNDLVRIHNFDEPMIDRLIKAAQLLCTGSVYDNGEVKSQTRDGLIHNTAYHNGKYSCSCEDGRAHDPILGKCCKHVLAQHLAYLMALELPEAPDSRDTALPAYIDNRDRLENWLG